MKLLQSTKGQVIRVCDCHYDKVKHWRWSALDQGRLKKSFAAVREQKIEGKHVTILMHRFIMDCPFGLVVDHVNGDQLDNRCSNLRICTRSQNNANQRGAKANSKSGYKGIYWHKAAEKWCAEVVYEHKKYYLGVFKNKLDAVEAYNKKAKELHGEFFAKS